MDELSTSFLQSYTSKGGVNPSIQCVRVTCFKSASRSEKDSLCSVRVKTRTITRTIESACTSEVCHHIPLFKIQGRRLW